MKLKGGRWEVGCLEGARGGGGWGGVSEVCVHVHPGERVIEECDGGGE